MNKQRTQAGFTLIELMIVVAVIAILAAIAYPNYTESVRKSRRGQAKADMLELAQLLERFRTVNSTYTGFTVPTHLVKSPRTGTTYYNLDVSNLAATTFTISATPQGSQTTDTRCGTLTLNQAGVKTEAGTGTVSDCW